NATSADGFTERRDFFVIEGQSASAELRGKITACGDISPLGACRLSDDTCIQSTEQDCINVGDGDGEYLGDGTECPPTGACILPDDCCTEGTEQECLDAGGEYQGDNTECEEYLVEVPDVIGMTEATAEAAVNALCLKAETECVVMEISPPAGEVVSQEPAGGDLVDLNHLVNLGISFGESVAPRSVGGAGSGVFENPSGPAGMVVTGVGTNYFTWGDPGSFGTGPSSLTFDGTAFSALTEQEFFLGTLTFYNGTVEMYSDADTIDLKVYMELSSPSGISQNFIYSLELIDTPGNRNTPPEIQADIVNLASPSPGSIFTLDGVDYTLELTFGNVIGGTGGFSERKRFFVYEGESASAELRGKITACVESLPTIDDLYARAKSGKIDIVWTPVEGAESYKIFRGTTQGGPYELIADGHITDYCVYADFGLTNGVTYYYVVRWVDAHGQESPDSNEAGATPMGRIRRR
ncbi:MAG: PASTA domain-containing protein, partial [bacterium]|nr:PASTA domain-containing protein [bacterium]